MKNSKALIEQDGLHTVANGRMVAKTIPSIKLICGLCGGLPRTHAEVLEINNDGVHHSCATEDHVMADVQNQKKQETREMIMQVTGEDPDDVLGYGWEEDYQ